MLLKKNKKEIKQKNKNLFIRKYHLIISLHVVDTLCHKRKVTLSMKKKQFLLNLVNGFFLKKNNFFLLTIINVV